MKKITGLALALCVLLTAAGCGGDTESSSDSTSEAASQSTTADKTESTSKTEVVVQTVERPSTEDAAPEETIDAGAEDDGTHILQLNEKTTYEYRWSEEIASSLVECEYTAILLGSDDAARFPALAAALADEAANGESLIKNEYAMLSEAVDELTGMGIELQEPLAAKYDAQVRRADDVVLSIVTDCTYNNGMNGGHRSFWGTTYDTQTGETLHLPDIVTDMDAFAMAVEEQLFTTVGKEVFYNDGIIREYFDMYGADGTHWSLDYNGITMYFDDGEIADLGVGGINTTITFAENAELFKEKYMVVPDGYIVSLPMKYMFNTDFDYNGDCENVIIYDSYDEDNSYMATITLYLEDHSYSESFWAYRCEPYYVKTADGRHYIYFFTELETQMYLYVYELTNGFVEKVGEESVSPCYYDGMSAVLTDPEYMRFDIFSGESGGDVSEGSDIFAISTDGMPAVG